MIQLAKEIGFRFIKEVKYNDIRNFFIFFSLLLTGIYVPEATRLFKNQEYVGILIGYLILLSTFSIPIAFFSSFLRVYYMFLCGIAMCSPVLVKLQVTIEYN